MAFSQETLSRFFVDLSDRTAALTDPRTPSSSFSPPPFPSCRRQGSRCKNLKPASRKSRQRPPLWHKDGLWCGGRDLQKPGTIVTQQGSCSLIYTVARWKKYLRNWRNLSGKTLFPLVFLICKAVDGYLNCLWKNEIVNVPDSEQDVLLFFICYTLWYLFLSFITNTFM